jgi:hypothetical protein
MYPALYRHLSGGAGTTPGFDPGNSLMEESKIMKEARIASGWAKQYIRERGGIINIATRMTVVD